MGVGGGGRARETTFLRNLGPLSIIEEGPFFTSLPIRSDRVRETNDKNVMVRERTCLSQYNSIDIQIGELQIELFFKI